MSSAPTAKKDAEAKPAAAGHPSGDKRFKMLDVTMKRLLYQQDALIEVLHSAQELFGYLEDDLLLYIAQASSCRPAGSTASRPSTISFLLNPQGEHTCVVCLGTACYVKGADGCWRHSNGG